MDEERKDALNQKIALDDWKAKEEKRKEALAKYNR
jgi:hypothetical protein